MNSPRSGARVAAKCVLWMALLLALVVALPACSSDSSEFSGLALAEPSDKPDFILTDTGGRSYDFIQETEGFLTLLFFGYTSCPDICPVHMAQINAVLDEHPDMKDRVKVVFVTIDPERDTPTALREWLDAFDPSFVGLTGSAGELIEAQEAAAVPVAFRVDGEDGAEYTMGHSALVLAYAPDGLGYTAYPFPTRRSQWENDLPLLLELGGDDV